MKVARWDGTSDRIVQHSEVLSFLLSMHMHAFLDGWMDGRGGFGEGGRWQVVDSNVVHLGSIRGQKSGGWRLPLA